MDCNVVRQVNGMDTTRRVELVFPRSKQVLPVEVPADVWQRVVHINSKLSSSYKDANRAVVPAEHFHKQRACFA